MKIKDIIKQLEETDTDLDIVIHDGHKTYNIIDVRNDIVFGEECVAIVIDRYNQAERK